MYLEVLATTIRAHREKLGISQEKLAAKADISPRNYRRIESGAHQPDLETIYKICVAIDVHYVDIIEASFQDYKETLDDR